MPQYTYKCIGCKEEFDRIVNVDYRDAWQICPKCDSDSARIKIPSGTLFDLKGKGFYRQGMPKQ